MFCLLRGLLLRVAWLVCGSLGLGGAVPAAPYLNLYELSCIVDCVWSYWEGRLPCLPLLRASCQLVCHLGWVGRDAYPPSVGVINLGPPPS